MVVGTPMRAIVSLMASDAAESETSGGRLNEMVEAARLSARATLAQNYFALRVADATKRLLDDTVKAYARSLALTQNRYNAGVAARVDVVQAEVQLKSTQAQLIARRGFAPALRFLELRRDRRVGFFVVRADGAAAD